MPKKKKSSENKYSSLVLLASLAISVYFIYRISHNIDLIQRIVMSSGVLAPIVCVLVFAALSLTPVSSDPVMLISGALFGPVLGALVNWMGNNIAAMIEYLIGKNVSDIGDFEKKMKKLPFGLGKLPVTSGWFLFFGRFVPQFGGKFVSISAGVYHVPFKKYFWTAVLANSVGAIIIALGGNELMYLLKSLL